MEVKRYLNPLIVQVVIAIWVIGVINFFLNYQLNQFGILPRHLSSLAGIIASPFLHGGFLHLLNNTIVFIPLAWLVSLYNKPKSNVLIKLTVFVMLLGGLLTWLMARSSYHVGLSGVIFGYWGFITVNGYFEKSLKSILLSLLAIIIYGGMVFGIFPTSSMVSFEGHFFGALSGVLYSYFYRRK